MSGNASKPQPPPVSSAATATSLQSSLIAALQSTNATSTPGFNFYQMPPHTAAGPLGMPPTSMNGAHAVLSREWRETRQFDAARLFAYRRRAAVQLQSAARSTKSAPKTGRLRVCAARRARNAARRRAAAIRHVRRAAVGASSGRRSARAAASAIQLSKRLVGRVGRSLRPRRRRLSVAEARRLGAPQQHVQSIAALRRLQRLHKVRARRRAPQIEPPPNETIFSSACGQCAFCLDSPQFGGAGLQQTDTVDSIITILSCLRS